MIKQIILILILLTTTLWAAKNITISMHGDLDDDLFILKSMPEKSDFLACLQMHNPTDKFLYDGKVIKSEKIYGKVDFQKKYQLAKDEILLIMTANEREEINPQKALLQRTHYKSVALFADNEPFIPSLLPENKDVPNYPLWFGRDDAPCMANTSSYNYYKLWENAIVNLGLVFGNIGEYSLYFINTNNQIVFQKSVSINTDTKNIHLLGKHTLREADGTVFAGNNKNQTIKEKAVDAIIIEYQKKSRYIKLPYLFPYINRIFVKGL